MREVIGKKARKFTQKEIDDFVKLATKNGDKNKVMLGRFEGKDVTTSYQNRARYDGYTYFDLGDTKWNEASNIVDGNADEMWKINKKFIDDNKNKEFFFSHDPFNPNYKKGFYEREINYLTSPINSGGLGGVIVREGDLWKLIW
jgi:hypothetical protein